MTDNQLFITPQMMDLLRVGEEIEYAEARKVGALGYMAQAMVLATLPHKNPGDVSIWARENGNYALVVKSGTVRENGHLVDAGIPYGTKPRLLMAWITTEAVRTRNRELILGESLSAFMRNIGMEKITGGRNGSITSLRDQMKRTLTATFSCIYGDNKRDAGGQFMIAKKYDLWWKPQDREQAGLFQSTLTLDDDFYQEVISNPVPVDIRALKALKGSAMGLDIYLWLTYRNSYLTREMKIPWIGLMQQFGAGYKEPRMFKHFFEEHLKKVLVVYPAVRVDSTSEFLILKPSPTSVAKR